MELDELRQKWLEHDRKFEISIRLNRQLLRDALHQKGALRIVASVAMLAAGSAFLLGVIGWLRRVHPPEPGNARICLAGGGTRCLCHSHRRPVSNCSSPWPCRSNTINQSRVIQKHIEKTA